MSMVTKETLELVKDGAKGAVELVTQGTTVLVNETINLYLFYGVLGLLKAGVVFVVYFIVKKFIDAMLETANPQEANKLKALKSTAIVISLIFFTAKSMPYIHDMGKALVAPNLFLAEKAAEILKSK